MEQLAYPKHCPVIDTVMISRITRVVYFILRVDTIGDGTRGWSLQCSFSKALNVFKIDIIIYKVYMIEMYIIYWSTLVSIGGETIMWFNLEIKKKYFSMDISVTYLLQIWHVILNICEGKVPQNFDICPGFCCMKCQLQKVALFCHTNW